MKKNERIRECYQCPDKYCVENHETNRREIWDKYSKSLLATTNVKIKSCIKQLKK